MGQAGPISSRDLPLGAETKGAWQPPFAANFSPRTPRVQMGSLKALWVSPKVQTMAEVLTLPNAAILEHSSSFGDDRQT